MPGLWSDWNGGKIGCIAGIVRGKRVEAGGFLERSKNPGPSNIRNLVLLPGFDSVTTLKPLVNGDSKSDLCYKQVLS